MKRFLHSLEIVRTEKKGKTRSPALPENCPETEKG
jgi:hypothetical protein